MAVPLIGRNYPHGGAVIGPLWRRVWMTLQARPDGVTVNEVCDLVNHPKRSTVAGLLRQARSKGILVSTIPEGSRKVVFRIDRDFDWESRCPTGHDKARNRYTTDKEL